MVVRLLSRAEVEDLKTTWYKWDYFMAHDEDCKQDYLGDESVHIRLVCTALDLFARLDQMGGQEPGASLGMSRVGK